MTKRPTEAALEGIDRMLEMVYDWDSKVNKFTASGSDDDDVVVTHDCTGRVIECSIRPGLQGELTRAELEDEINDAISSNAERAREGLQALANEFLAKFAEIPKELAEHPMAEKFAQSLHTGRTAAGM